MIKRFLESTTDDTPRCFCDENDLIKMTGFNNIIDTNLDHTNLRLCRFILNVGVVNNVTADDELKHVIKYRGQLIALI